MSVAAANLGRQTKKEKEQLSIEFPRANVTNGSADAIPLSIDILRVLLAPTVVP